MKKLIIFLILTSISIVSCKSKQEKKLDNIHKNVENYLMINLNDPSSYQSVEFGKVDSLFDNYSDTKQFTQIQDSITTTIESLDKSTNLFGSISTENAWSHVRYDWYSGSKFDKVEKHQIDSLNNEIDKLQKLSLYLINRDKVLDSLYIPKFIGYTIEHKYRAKNKMGALELEDKVFKLDTNLKIKG